MTTLGKRARVAGILCVIAAIPLGAAWYGSASRGLNPLTAWACSATPRGGLSNVSGWDLEIEESHCDLLTRETAITVYASPHGASSSPGWFLKRTMLFRYTPESGDELLPGFESPAPDRILITVPAVAAVAVRKQSLGNTVVNYHIGRIEYGTDDGLREAH